MEYVLCGNQAASRVMWRLESDVPAGYAKSGDGTPSVRKELFSELADAASLRVDEFNAQELGNTVNKRCRTV